MPVSNFHFWSVAVVVALATCSCSQPGTTRASHTAAKPPGETSNLLNRKSEIKPSPKVPEPEAYLSSDIRVGTVDRKEINKRFGYGLDIHYPQITKPRTRNQRRFNTYVRRLIENDIKAFRAYCAKSNKHRDGTKRRMEYHLGMNYEVFFATTEVLSINLTLESFTGYLNSDWFPIPLNYDLKAGKALVLADIFKRRSKFLKVIADYSVDEFTRRGLNCGGGGVSNEQWMREGTKPKADNYANWSLTRSGIQITFGEYQVGPGCLGLVTVVVPYDRFRGILRQEEWLPVEH